MPELPEVETVRLGLAPVMEGAKIAKVEQRRADLRFPFPDRFADRLQGRTVTAMARRAKYLLTHLDDGLVLISHLGMSGSFRIEAAEQAMLPGEFHRARSRDERHDHAVFHLERDGRPSARIVFNDPRRFGFMLLADGVELDRHPRLAGLGVEPTGNALDGALLSAMLRGRKTSVKAALLDQGLIAGLGNIYVCEALWRAGLSPSRNAASIASAGETGTARSDRLASAIRAVIAEAIAAGGSSLRDYMQTDGSLGYFQHSFAVYDREGQACRKPGCGGAIRRIVQAGRSTFYCPACQR